MKIHVEHGDFLENEVILRCAALDDEMLEVLSLLKERSAKLVAQKDGEAHMLAPSQLYYAEAVEGKTFLYTEEAVLETGQSLARLEELYGDTGFLRIGKSQLVNLYRVAKLRSMPNARIEISLQNGEKLVASRHYARQLKAKLNVME